MLALILNNSEIVEIHLKFKTRCFEWTKSIGGMLFNADRGTSSRPIGDHYNAFKAHRMEFQMDKKRNIDGTLFDADRDTSSRLEYRLWYFTVLQLQGLLPH